MNIFKSKAEIIFSIYILFGSLWILTSDYILGLIAPDFLKFQFVSTIKGLGYVSVSGTIFYLIIKKFEDKRVQTQKLELLGLATIQISHDLKNIFGIIKGWTQLAQFNQESGTSSKEEMKNSVNGLEKALILIDRLLIFTKDSNQTKIDGDLNQIIADFIQNFANLILSPKIHLNSQLAPNLPRIRVNRNEMEQILLNLVLNAQYAILHKEPPSHPKTIEIKTRTEKRKKAKTKYYIVLEVCDTGMGMSSKTLKKIFHPFFTTKSGSEGSGLGLSSIAKIVKNSKGEIRVQSHLNIGTTFSIYWPVSYS